MSPDALTAQAVADLVGGRLLGNGDARVAGVAPLDRAGPEHVSFLASGRYLEAFRGSRAGIVLLKASEAEAAGGPSVRIVVEDPHRALSAVAARLYPDRRPAAGVDPTARLGPGVVLGADVHVGPFAVLGPRVTLGPRVVIGPGTVLDEGASVGEDSVLGPHVTVGHDVRIGARVTVKAGAVIGGTGFGYLSGPEGHRRIPHVGTVVIGDDVDIGSQVCIDRGSVGDTEVGPGTKIDNLVQLGHNVRLGAHCLLMAGVGIAGSTRVGDGVILTGQVGLAGHLTLGDGARVGAGSKVYSSVPAGGEVSGFPARPHREFLRAQGAMYRLAPLVRDLEALVKERQGHG